MALEADVTALKVPEIKASHVNDNSLTDASPTPPMMGTKLAYTGMGRNSLKHTAKISADQTGSVALRM